MRPYTVVALLAWSLAVEAVPCRGAEPPADIVSRPLSPEESLRTIKVPEGFVVELMAAEPLVVDPVAFAWGATASFGSSK